MNDLYCVAQILLHNVLRVVFITTFDLVNLNSLHIMRSLLAVFQYGTSHRHAPPRVVGAVGIGLVVLCCLLTPAGQARAELLIGLTNSNGLFTIDSSAPGLPSSLIPITGLGGETLYDIDIRPADQLLYGLSNAGKLYTINRTTGAAVLNTSLTGITLDVTATRFGIDFNPTVDRLRIVSNTGQDLRLTPGTGVTTIDTNLNGDATGAVSVAYTNNDNDPATATALFYIGPSVPNTLFSTSNPNGGVLTTVGPLGVSSTQDVGFDISGLSGIAFATLTPPTGLGSSLYTVNLATGAATLVGTVGGGQITVRGLAASPALAAVPESGNNAGLLGLALASLIIAQRALASRKLVAAQERL